MTGDQLAAAATGLVGVPFRLNGRDPRLGLDCIGVLETALTLIGRPARLPVGYPLKLRDLSHWLPDPLTIGLTAANGPTVPGDVLLIAAGPAQFHLAIAVTATRFVHAHAGLRRVVVSPCRPDGELVGRWRLAPQ